MQKNLISGLPRQCGKTTALIQFVMNTLQPGLKNVVVTPNDSTSRHYFNTFCDLLKPIIIRGSPKTPYYCITLPKNSGIIISHSQSISSALRGYKINTVAADEWKWIKPDNLYIEANYMFGLSSDPENEYEDLWFK